MTRCLRRRASRPLVALALALLGGAAAPGTAALALVRSPSDGIRLIVPGRVRRDTVYDVTVSGFSRRRAHAYLFVDYQGCASSFSAELVRASSESEHYSVKGKFAQTTGWKSSQAGDDHACAYLVALRSGVVLARAKRAYPVG